MKVRRDDWDDVLFYVPDYRWKLYVGPNFVITLTKAPNALNRLMQRLVFGFRWEEIKEAAHDRATTAER